MTRGLTDYLTDSARRRPSAPAVRAEGVTISYAELRQVSDQLAADLMSAGVCTGDCVALWLDKSIEAIVAIHGVLRCGATYVPVDPSTAVQRALTIMRDATVSALITTVDRRDLLDDRMGTVAPKALLVTDSTQRSHQTGAVQLSWPVATDQDDDEAAQIAQVSRIQPDDPAYILYTSGSTGSPKGVTLSHRNATSFVDWAVAEFRITGADRLASHAPLHFDLSILDVFAAAAAGACLVLVPERHRAIGRALNRFVHEKGITIWYSVPGALIMMLEPDNRSLLAQSPLRTVLFAGDVFPIKHLRSLHHAVPEAELWNLYGPTETNVCTYHQVDEHDLDPARTTPPPIGRACPYATAFLVSPDDSAVEWALGVEGELCITGESVMLGYWGDLAKTEQRFIALPGIDGVPVRAYRTGDIVQVDERGDLVFVARRDQMVKTRGYRVELGEIEATLLSYDKVVGAACVAVPDPHIGASIEAYLVHAPNVQIDLAALRKYLLDTLPRYMLPARFEVIEAFPCTSTGKIDRQDLLKRSVAWTQTSAATAPARGTLR